MKARISIFFLISFVALSAYAQKSDAEKFIGRWVSNDAGYTMEATFKADGTGIVDGDRVIWTAQSGSLVLTVDGEKETYKYVFNESGFRVSGGDLEMPLNFKKANASAKPATSQNQDTNATGKGIDNPGVRKWEYVHVASANSGERWITIKPDGTYEYYSRCSSNDGTSSKGSDRSKWWTQGSRLHYNSQAQGQAVMNLLRKIIRREAFR
jgi:hypothetical protein